MALLWAGLFLMGSVSGSVGEAMPRYLVGEEALTRWTSNLIGTLELQDRAQFHPSALVIRPAHQPYLRFDQLNDGIHAGFRVELSTGLVSLFRNLTHAKAIDALEPGFFRKYVCQLALEPGDRPWPEVTTGVATQAWTLPVLNEQAGLFAELSGTWMAIQMAHRQLGHDRKYGTWPNTTQAELDLINRSVTASEWRTAARHGARHAMICGMGSAGFRALLEAAELMPTRPTWMANLIPPGVEFKRIRRDLRALEIHYRLGPR